MTNRFRLAGITAMTATLLGLSLQSPMRPASAEAQGRAVPRPPEPGRAEPRRPPVRGRVVFVGGYFYDPFFGPYPWWPRAQYPYAYFPMYDNRAEVRLLVTPLQVAEWLAADETSEPPPLSPAVPPPPPNTFSPPRTPPRRALVPPPQAPTTPSRAVTLATLMLHVHPAEAEVTIDGARWVSSDGEHFVVQIATGQHRVDVFKRGYQGFSTEIHVREGDTTPISVSLSPEDP